MQHDEPRLLGPAEEWLLWRAAAEEACAGLDLLAPGNLADDLRRSAALARDWGMSWPGEPTQESRVLHRARRLVEARCRELRARPVSDWTQSLARTAVQAAPLLVAGFDAPGPALEARLRQLGARFGPSIESASVAMAAAAAGARPTHVEVVTGADLADELRRAALWCRGQLQANPDARLLVVDLLLERRRALALQAFEHELLAGAVMQGQVEPPFAIEGGQELAAHAVVGAALSLLQFAGEGLDFPELAALLRSPYIALGDRAARAALELRLRQRNLVRADGGALLALARAGADAGAAALATGLERVVSIAAEGAGRRDRPASWGRHFAALLTTAGWPGPAVLGSIEQQQCERLRELLGEYSMLGTVGEALGPGQALGLLRALALRTAFDAASGDVPVTITASLDDPLATYDGIWVAGLGADTWPQPPRADPFVPLAAQHAANLPAVSARARADEARRRMAAWERRAPRLVYSWPGSDGDVPLQPSGMLAASAPRAALAAPVVAASVVPVPVAAAPVAPIADELVAAIRRDARRDGWPLERARPWPEGVALVGGTRVLDLQSQCPFRAAAELRLGAEPMPDPVPGLDHRDRGLMLHHALELAWRQLGDSATLQRRASADPGLEALARECAGQALRERLAQRAAPLSPRLADNEQRRLAALLAAFLQQELERAAAATFRVDSLERSQERELGGRSLRVRMDRVDRFGDGRVVVIDYKSGAAQPFRPLDERPRQPQLLAYALLAGPDVAGVAAVHLTASGIDWRGASADPALLPKLPRARPPGVPWPGMLAHWRRTVDRLLSDFAAGTAGVDPLPGACQTCHLASLCRIDSARQLEPDTDPDSDSAAETEGGLDAS